MKAVYFESVGGPENLHFGDRPTPKPAAGEVLIRVAAAGVNFIDTYHRTGLYPVALPFVPGVEGAGTVEQLGEGATGFAVGDRVAWCMQPGGYAQYASIATSRIVKLPEALSFETAAAVLLQGMTAHYLTHSTFPLARGNAALIHAAAGGTGLLLVQMAKMLGAHVIGTTGTEEKAALALEAGADDVIVYTKQDFAVEVKRITGGAGVDVVYDSVGKSTFEGGLNSLKPRGYMVTFGNASGPVPEISPLLLSQKGSLFLTRPSLAHYILTPAELAWRAGDVFRWTVEGSLKVRIGHTFPLEAAAQAHRDLESRRTTGKLVLTP
jgi:NADPH2:quinone reductase